MGVMRFVDPDASRLTPEVQKRTFIVGMDGIPWQLRVHPADDGFSIHKVVDESGCLHTPWPVAGFGEPLLCTTSLRERPEPYFLPLEIARGALNRLRNQAAAWQVAGLDLPANLQDEMRDAARHFSKAATSQNDPRVCADYANSATRQALVGMQSLADCFADQLLNGDQPTQMPQRLIAATIDAGALSDSGDILSHLDTIAVPMNWKECEPQDGEFDWESVDKMIDWCRRQDRRVIGGPVLRFDEHSLPGWLYLSEGEYEALETSVVRWARALGDRMAGKVNLWHCGAAMNTGDVLKMNEEERLRLTIAALSGLQDTSPRTPMLISFDQPWAEYMGHNDSDVSPLHYADAIARSELNVAGFGLELNIGYEHGSLPRDPLAISQLIDAWSQLGLPLIVFLTMPSDMNEDAAALNKSRILPGPVSDQITPQSHAAAVQRVLRMLLCKQSVQGIVWNQWTDARPHAYPHGGLLDAKSQPKPVCDVLSEVVAQNQPK